MKLIKSLLFAIILVGAAFNASAGNEVLHLDVEDAIADSYSAGKFDGSVKFYFAGQGIPKVMKTYSESVINKKINGVGKSVTEH